jgi:tetratricopeptide (TPR) repeat protein
VDALTEEIARHRRELRSDPRSLRFVPLADALRRAGALDEALRVLDQGFAIHPAHKTALLVRARVFSDAGRGKDALTLLDELYPRDRGNLALIELYVELLSCDGRTAEARAVLAAAELAGATPALRERLLAVIEEEEAGLTELGALEPLESLYTLPGASVDDLGDPFLVEPVVRRVLRAGSREAGARLWAEWRGALGGGETSALRPRNLRVDAVSRPPPALPSPAPAAVPALRRLLAVLEAAPR